MERITGSSTAPLPGVQWEHREGTQTLSAGRSRQATEDSPAVR